MAADQFSAYAIWKMCGRKFPYVSQEAAERAIVSKERQGIRALKWYRCTNCGSIHIGHRK